jgi:calnexin
MGYAHAEEEADATVAVQKPTFTVCCQCISIFPPLTCVNSLQPTSLKAPFLEQFTDDWESRWKPSHAKKDDKSEDDWAYVGEWAVEEPSVFKGIDGDKGLVVKNAAAHHAISAKFPKKIDNKGKTLVVQYEVKPQSKSLASGIARVLMR